MSKHKKKSKRKTPPKSLSDGDRIIQAAVQIMKE